MSFNLSYSTNQSLTLALLALVGIFIVAAFSLILPPGVDWQETYQPATVAVLKGGNPYDPEVAPNAPFFAAPWGVLPLIPMALLPLPLGRALLFVVSLIAFAYTVKKLGGSLITMLLFLLSPPVVHSLLNANIEWIPLLGFVLPPQIGLFFIAVKPQTGFAVGLFWLAQAWRQGRWRQVLITFAPVTVATLLSFALYGLWPFRFNNVLNIAQDFNASLWPMSIPVGLTLIVTSIRAERIEYAMPASPCLAPYVLFHSWSSAVVALASRKAEMFTAVIGLWLLVIIRALS
jgi:hypothetical protein